MVGCGVAGHVEPAATTVGVYPSFEMNAFGIGAKKHVIAPFLFRQLIRMFGSGNMRFAMTAEFRLVAFPTPGTLDDKH